MLTKKLFFLITAFGLIGGSLTAVEASVGKVGVVNFATCINDSKFGKQEQENLEHLRKQMTSLMKDTEDELQGLNKKLQDSEYMDGLSPKAEEEIKVKYQTLNEDLARYQGQFYQVLQQANYQLMQKMNGNITAAAKRIASKKKLGLVINKEACFYSDDTLEITPHVIEEMNKDFEKEQKQLSQNGAQANQEQKELSQNEVKATKDPSSKK